MITNVEMIEKFREKIKDMVFSEYTRKGIIRNRVCLLAKSSNGDWIIGFKRVPGFLHLEGEEFEYGYSELQRRIQRFIKVIQEDDNEVIGLIHVEIGEEDGTDFIFTSLKTGDNFSDVDIECFECVRKPMNVTTDGSVISEPPEFVKTTFFGNK